jgi:capsular polysaccharide export protein
LKFDTVCDPWHLFDHFEEIWADADSDYAFLAALAGKSLTCWGEGRFSGLGGAAAHTGSHLADLLLTNDCFSGGLLDPFTRSPMSLTEAAKLLIFWKGLIDSNRNIDQAAGFAFWKRPTVAPLLWPGAHDILFSDDLSAANENSVIAAWSSRLPSKAREQIARNKPQIIEIEDGFIRSSGLGANCVPPLSIMVDRRGIYFDPAKESDLENILQNAVIPEEIQQKAEALRQAIVASSISKYGNTSKASMPIAQLRTLGDGRKLVLVPGQVEDDRSVQSGGGNITSNLDLLKRARACEPEAFVIYKPHPDVEAGHRIGVIDDAVALEFADLIVRDTDIAHLLSAADHVHVLTSLTGFEALLRGKPVTTHGVPFYAGWGLTQDLGEIPVRRTMRRNLSELIAASLILYTRYLDPITGLPCGADILIKRLQNGLDTPKSALTRFRQLQGFIRATVTKRIRSFGA